MIFAGDQLEDGSTPADCYNLHNKSTLYCAPTERAGNTYGEGVYNQWTLHLRGLIEEKETETRDGDEIEKTSSRRRRWRREMETEMMETEKDEFEETETGRDISDTDPPPPPLARRIVRTIAKGSNRPLEHEKYVTKVLSALHTIAWMDVKYRGKLVIPSVVTMNKPRMDTDARLHGNFRLEIV